MKFNIRDFLRTVIVAVLVILASSLSFSAYAKKNYITDQFDIMLRVAPGMGAKIIKLLPTGTPLEVIIEDAGKAHSQVQTQEGLVGYVLTRFISNRPAARDRVASLEKQLASLRSDPSKIKSQYLDLQSAYEGMSRKFSDVVDVNDDLNRRYEKLKRASSDVVVLTEKSDRLEKEVQQLVLQMDDMRIENAALRDQSEKKSWLFGGAIAIFGVFFGAALVSVNRKKHY